MEAAVSIHKSLVSVGKLVKHRNVLSRSERLEILKKEGRWDDEKSVFGLVKVRNIMQKAKPKAKKVDETAEGAAAAAPATTGAATPASTAKTPAAKASATKASTPAKASAPAADGKAKGKK